MKKTTLPILIFAGFIAFSSNFAQAYFSYDVDYSEVCKGAKVSQYNMRLDCKDTPQYSSLVRAKVGENVEQVPKEVLWNKAGAIELNVLPDADTSEIYSFYRELLDSDGKRIGYMNISGYHNYEMEIKLQLNTRYDLNGKLISAEVK